MPTFYRSRPPVVAGGRLCGSTAPAPNGGFFQPSMGTGTASTKGLPAGATGVSGNSCISISPTTRIWNTSSSTARWYGPTPALRERPFFKWLKSCCGGPPLRCGSASAPPRPAVRVGGPPLRCGSAGKREAGGRAGRGPPLRCGSAPKRAAKQPRPWDGAAAGSAPRST